MIEEIRSPRLLIRPPKPEDSKQLHEATTRSLKELIKWLPWAKDHSFKKTEEFIDKSMKKWGSNNQNDFPLIVIHKNSNEIIAASGYNDKSNPSIPYYEICYWLDSTHSGKGYATELTNALTQYAFKKLNAIRVQIRAQIENKKSIAVAKRCGYTQEAILKNVARDCVLQLPYPPLRILRLRHCDDW